MYDIPILFIIFRRKDVALQSLQRIRSVQPAKLYIAADGPRTGVEDEAKAVEQTRQAVLSAIDWPCDVKTLFQTENLGCSKGVYTAISWLFDNEEQGIILEDDCMMQQSFFPFVQEMLTRYKDDERIGMIDGANYIKDVKIPDSYGFSLYKATNGWATWRRAWRNMDLDMTWRNTPYAESIIANMGYRSRDIKYWKYRISVVDHHDASAWDWQWYFTLAAHNQLGIYPCCSLQSNIGFGEGATHTSGGKVPSYYTTDQEMQFPLRHPRFVVPYQPFEKGFYDQNNTLYTNLMKYLPIPIKMWLKKTFHI